MHSTHSPGRIFLRSGTLSSLPRQELKAGLRRFRGILLWFIVSGLSSTSHAQTIYVPGGTVGDSGNSNVGIGTSDPGTKLEVAGTVKTTDTTASTSTTSGALVVAGGLGLAKSIYGGGEAIFYTDRGTIGTGFTNAPFRFGSTITGASDGGSLTPSMLIYQLTAGSNNISQEQGLLLSTTHAGSGTVAIQIGASAYTNINSTGGTTGAVGYLAYAQFNSGGTGNITSSYRAFHVGSPVYTGSGRITGDAFGLSVNNLGHASSTTVIGVDIADQTKGSGNAYAYRGQMAAAAGKYNLFMSGTADNHLAGNLGLGSVSMGGGSGNLRIALPITGAANSVSTLNTAQVQSDVTTAATIFQSLPSTQATAFTLSSMTHYNAAQGTFGSGSSVTVQNGFNVASSLTGAATNYGFRGQLAAASGRWNLYMDGTAANYLAGNVGIGTTNPTYKLSVNGTVRAKEVIVDTGWSDYVFAEGYRLAPLSEVETHIKEHKHLPGIPSAAKVEQEGVSLGEMQALLLAKIEELTLHQIAQEKEIQALKNDNLVIRADNAELRQGIHMLKWATPVTAEARDAK